MKDQGSANVLLGIEILRDRVNRKLLSSQHKCIKEVLKRFQIEDCKSVTTPIDKTTIASLETGGEMLPSSTPYRQAIGLLIYLVRAT